MPAELPSRKDIFAMKIIKLDTVVHHGQRFMVVKKTKKLIELAEEQEIHGITNSVLG